MDIDDYESTCPLVDYPIMRADSLRCGSLTQTNIAKHLPDLSDELVSSLLLSKGWTSNTSLLVELGAMYPIDGVSVRNLNAGVQFMSYPTYYNNSLSWDDNGSCTASTCEWSFATPKASSFLFSPIDYQGMTLSNLNINLGSFHPVDGTILFNNEWTVCSNTCGTGAQYRIGRCRQPLYVSYFGILFYWLTFLIP